MICRRLSPWIVLPGDYCAMRTLLGADPADVSKRVAFIEKSPRVRVFADDYAWQNRDSVHTCGSAERDAWLYGPKGSGGADGQVPENRLYGYDPDSRAWADNLLRALGYELTEGTTS